MFIRTELGLICLHESLHSEFFFVFKRLLHQNVCAFVLVVAVEQEEHAFISLHDVQSLCKLGNQSLFSGSNEFRLHSKLMQGHYLEDLAPEPPTIDLTPNLLQPHSDTLHTAEDQGKLHVTPVGVGREFRSHLPVSLSDHLIHLYLISLSLYGKVALDQELQ